MKPIVVLATDSPEPSGLGQHMLTLGVALAPRYDVVLACPDQPAGSTLLRQAAENGLRIKALDVGRPVTVRDWLSAAGVALLHVHAGIGWEGHALARCGKAAGLPVVRTEHLPYLLTRPVQQAEYRAMLLSVDCRIAVSQAVFDSHLEAGNGRQQVVRNGVAPPRATRAAPETRRSLGIAETDRLLLTIARFTPQKGHAVLLAAIPAVLHTHPNARFILVGTGPELEVVRAAIEAGGLQENVLLLGPRDDVPDLLAAAEMAIIPSHFEGLSLALLEAMAMNIPVVATAVGGTVEALGESHPLLVPAGDAVALADAVIRALDQPELARSAARAARARFETGFTAERMAAETAAIYGSLLSSPNLQGSSA